jgi:hypothetical protein
MLTIPGVDLDGESSNNNISFIEACRNKNTIPKLVLMEKPSAFTRKVFITFSKIRMINNIEHLGKRS